MLWIDVMIACMLSDCQYIRMVNFGYYIILLFIVYCCYCV